MASYTANYGLHQWEAADDFLRTDFNTDFQKIDEALGAAYTLAESRADLVTGTYTGDGQASRTISLGFTPVWFLSFDSAGHSAIQGSCYGGLALTGSGVTHGSGYGLQIVEGGIQVGYEATISLRTNTSGQIYYYIACKP